MFSSVSLAFLISLPVFPSDASNEQIATWIRELGSSDYSIRLNAFRQLEKTGRPAFAPLKDAAKSSDLEVRSRAAMLVESLRKLDFEARMSDCAADLKGEKTHNLPGLEDFLKRTNGSTSARKFFGDMLKEPLFQRLLFAAESTPESLSGMTQAAVFEVMQRKGRGINIPPPGIQIRPVMQAPAPRQNGLPVYSLTDIMAILYVDALTPLEFRKQRRIGNTPTSLIYQQTIRNAVVKFENGKYVPATEEITPTVRAIVAKWFETREDPIELSSAISYAAQYGFPEIVAECSLKQLENSNATGPMKGIALANIAKSGGVAVIPKLEKYLTNKEQAATRYEAVSDTDGKMISKQHSIQFRDIALASILQLQNQDPKSYGMHVYSTTETMKFQSTNAWFINDEDRKKAFEKYEAAKKEKK